MMWFRSQLLLFTVLGLVGCRAQPSAEPTPGPTPETSTPETSSPEPAAEATTRPAAKPEPVSGITEADLERTRQLLRNYRRETLSSKIMRDPKTGKFLAPARTALVQARPVREMAQLYRQNDTTLRELGGTFVGILIQDMDGTGPFLPMVLDDLEHQNPRRRAFAAECLGYMGDTRYMPHLRAHANDREKVPGYSGDATVADFVGPALRHLEAVKAAQKKAQKKAEQAKAKAKKVPPGEGGTRRK